MESSHYWKTGWLKESIGFFPIFLFLTCCLFKLTYAQTFHSAEVERIAGDVVNGPESVAFDSEGYLYCSNHDGIIMKMNSDGSNSQVFAQTDGRPLGLKFDGAGNLIVADAYAGLLSINPDGEMTILTTSCGGLDFGLTNDLAIAQNGNVYFSDASWRYGLLDPDHLEDWMQTNGRLLTYDPVLDTTILLLDSLFHANGVVVGHDETYVLVSNSWIEEVRRYWIAGDQQGQTDVFIDLAAQGIPDLHPDNITFNGTDIYWTAIWNGPIVGIDLSGNIRYVIEFPGDSFPDLTSVIQRNDTLYLGNFIHSQGTQLPYPFQTGETGIGILHLPQLPYDISQDKYLLAQEEDSLYLHCRFDNFRGSEFSAFVLVTDLESTVVDSFQMVDDGQNGDSLAGDGLFGATILSLSVESIFSFCIGMVDQETGVFTQTENAGSFTNAGPVVFDSLRTVSIENPCPGDVFRVHMDVTNLSDSISIPYVAVQVTSSHPEIIADPARKMVGNLDPGETDDARYLRFDIAEFDLEMDSVYRFMVGVDIFSQGTKYWSDSAEIVIDGSLCALGIGGDSVIPTAFKLAQNYPNPFNPTTTISYDLPEQADVTLTVYDMKGREVMTLMNREQSAGHYKIQWSGVDGSGNPVNTGVYFARLQAGDYTQTIKMVYLR